jgi:hypothetical protein
MYLPGKADDYHEAKESCSMCGGDDEVCFFLLSAFLFYFSPFHTGLYQPAG